MKGNFQLITIVVFIGLAIFGVLVFSGAIPIGNDEEAGAQGTVTLWGTVKSSVIGPLIEEFNSVNQNFVVKYKQKSPDTFDQDLLEALASGEGPDLIFLPDDLAYHYANRIYPIPFESFPLASFKNNFAGVGEVFLTGEGILAFPLTIDPLVMYYNRNILDAEGIVYPPTDWDTFTALVPKLTKKDEANRITKSAVALGHFSNITHAKDILAALFMQGGSGIVKEEAGIFSSALETSNSKFSLASFLKFYTDFADPNREVYSWNKSLPNSSDAFSREDVAFYFGYGSELAALVNKNPNHNFFVSTFPQIAKSKLGGSNLKATMAHVSGIAIMESSQNFDAAFAAAGLLSSGNFASDFASLTGTVPARRDLLDIKQTDAFNPVFYNSAIYAKSWLDPSPKDTDDIWRRMIDSVLSNSNTPEGSISDASNRLGILLRQAK